MKLNIGKRQVLGLVAATALSLTMAAPAFAADDTTATVTGGSLTITNPAAADFAGRSITGADQFTTAALAAFSVSDLTGSGAGWNVTAQASQFTGVNHDLAAGSLSMTAPTVTANDTTSPEPTVNDGPYVIDDGDAVSIASAALDEGMGVYDFGATTLTLALPALDLYADAYLSTVTISIVSAP